MAYVKIAAATAGAEDSFISSEAKAISVQMKGDPARKTKPGRGFSLQLSLVKEIGFGLLAKLAYGKAVTESHSSSAKSFF